jgi:Tfp pilus assembly protein PilF
MAYCEVRAVLGGWKGSEAFVEAEALAKRAVELDSYDYANHWDLAYVYLNSGRFDQALSEYRRAILLNPNDADLLAEMAEMLVYTGRPEEAIAQISQAMVINPRFPDWYHWNLGWAAYNAKDYDGALEQLNQMSDPPNDVRLFVAAAHAQLGDVGAAEAALGVFLDERASPYTIADVRKRGRFKHRQDEEHWLDGLRKAGLPD